MQIEKAQAETESGARLTEFQSECVQVFVSAATVLAIPKSIGEIYGLFFGSRQPLCFDDVVRRLSLSKGAASQGLRWLRSVGAIEPVYVAGDRREHYVAQTELRRLITGILAERILPGLRDSGRKLSRLESAIGLEPTAEDAAFARSRVDRLKRWNSILSKSLPMLVRLVGSG